MTESLTAKARAVIAAAHKASADEAYRWIPRLSDALTDLIAALETPSPLPVEPEEKK